MEEKAKLNAYYTFINKIKFNKLKNPKIVMDVISTHPNITMEIIEKNIDKEWNWFYISLNPNLTLQFIDKYSNKDWNWYELSNNTIITLEFVNKYHNKDWRWDRLSDNINILMDLIIKYDKEKDLNIIFEKENPKLTDHLRHYESNWSLFINDLSYNSKISFDFIEKYIDYDWNWSHLTHHKDLSFEFIKKYPHKDWGWGFISEKSFITMEIIDQNPELPWCLASVTMNPNLSAYILEKYKDQREKWMYSGEYISKNIKLELKTNILSDLLVSYSKYSSILPLCLRGLSKNPGLTLEFIDQNPYIDEDDDYDYWIWGSNGISANPCLTIEILRKYNNKDWCWDTISSNPSLKIEMLEEFHNKEWNWDKISENPNLTMEILDKFIDKDWNWEKLSIHDNLSMNIVDKYNTKPWNWSKIQYNKNFTLELCFKYKKKKWDICETFRKFLYKQYEIELKKIKNFNNIEEELIQKTCHRSFFQE